MKFLNPLIDKNTLKMYKNIFTNTIQDKHAIEYFEELSHHRRIENLDIYHLSSDLNKLANLKKINEFRVYHGASSIDIIKKYYHLFSSFKIAANVSLTGVLRHFHNNICEDNSTIYFPCINIFTNSDNKFISDNILLFCIITSNNNNYNEIYYITSKKEFFKKHLWESYDKFMEHFETLKFIVL